MTAPSWPFSWPSPPGWGTDIDQTVELWPWRHKTSDVRIPAGYGEVTRLGQKWYATTLVQGSARSVGVYPSEVAAMQAVQQALGELAADS